MSGSKYLRIPFEERECERIEDELSLTEMKSAIVSAYNEKIEADDVGQSEDELAEYDTVQEIVEDSRLSEARRKQLKLKAERRSNIPNR